MQTRGRSPPVHEFDGFFKGKKAFFRHFVTFFIMAIYVMMWNITESLLSRGTFLAWTFHPLIRIGMLLNRWLCLALL